MSGEQLHFKDAVLNAIAPRANVAQFVSFSPELQQRFARVFGYEVNHRFADLRSACAALLTASGEQKVNVRSFDPVTPKSREFVQDLATVDAITATVLRLAGRGLYAIINETVDKHDGGVSGVSLGDILEFSPDDTPRSVERPGTAALPRALGIKLLQTVYGFAPALERYKPSTRVEFSIHPVRRGFRHEHTIIWELEEVGPSAGSADIRWPNRFSQFIGDKAFGLLIADLLGLPVPRTTVITRRIAPFAFGRATGSAESWIRTCPREQVPGKFTTHRGWLDPFALLNKEDPSGELIASVLAQEGVEAIYSGAAIASERLNGRKPVLTIEGTRGFGDEFMVGRKKRSPVPQSVQNGVKALYAKAAKRLGPVRFEWVADKQRTWIVQFHRGASPSHGRVIYPGKPATFRRFEVDLGLEPLRELIGQIAGTDLGIVLVGDVGVTSHFGDVLRKARVPSYISPLKMS